MTSQDPKQEPKGGFAGASDSGRYATLGLQYALTIALLTGIGWWLDGRLSTRPWLLVVGVLLGVVAGFVNLVRAVPSPPPARQRGKEPR